MPLPRPTRPVDVDPEPTKPVAPAAPTRALKPSDTFIFEPNGINAQELAELMAVFFNGIRIHHTIYAKLPENLQRQFRHQKII
jgi:hypothetical protein